MDIATVRAAVQEQIDSLVVGPSFPFRPVMVTPADAPEVLAMAQRWCAGKPLCGWETVFADPARLSPLLTGWLAVAARDRAGKMVAFGGDLVRDPPDYECQALMATGTLLAQFRAHAVRGTVVWRALVPLGFTTLVIPTVPTSVGFVLDDILPRLPEIQTTQTGTDMLTNAPVRKVRVDIRKALDRMEKVTI